MLTLEEARQLPIPERYKDTPNLYRLACILQSTGSANEILAAMDVAFTAAGMKKEEGAA